MKVPSSQRLSLVADATGTDEDLKEEKLALPTKTYQTRNSDSKHHPIGLRSMRISIHRPN